MNDEDCIRIRDLKLQPHLGVPDNERAQPQLVTVSLTIYPAAPMHDLDDDLENTVDYAQVCAGVRRLANQAPMKLMETLAEKIALHILENFAARKVNVDLRKYILPATRYVGVNLTRGK